MKISIKEKPHISLSENENPIILFIVIEGTGVGGRRGRISLSS